VTNSMPGPVVSVVGRIFGHGYRKNIAAQWNTA